MLPSEVTVCIPTFKNPQQLTEALISLVRNTDFSGRILVINNGSADYEEVQFYVPYEVDWINSGGNLGWEKSINLGLANSSTPLFCMSNDDILFPINPNFWKIVTAWFSNGKVGAVGPVSNSAYWYQTLTLLGLPESFICGVLIGFFQICLRDCLEEGLDYTLPGGDDIDLCIRIRNSGKHLVVDRRLFVFHYGAQTGNRLYPQYWGSEKHQIDAYNALIRKHGLTKWQSCWDGTIMETRCCPAT